MKYLFIVQGEGRGHLTQSMTLEKILLDRGHEVVGIMVGKSRQRRVPDFFTDGVAAPVTYFESMNNPLRILKVYNVVILWIKQF